MLGTFNITKFKPCHICLLLSLSVLSNLFDSARFRGCKGSMAQERDSVMSVAKPTFGDSLILPGLPQPAYGAATLAPARARGDPSSTASAARYFHLVP